MEQRLHNQETLGSTEAGLAESLERAWSAFQIYDADHPAFGAAASEAITGAGALADHIRQIMIDPESSEHISASDSSLVKTLAALDIGAVLLGADLGEMELACAFGVIRGARAARVNGPELAEQVSEQAGDSFRLIPLNYARLTAHVTNARPSGAGDRSSRLGVGELRSVLLGATTKSAQHSAASWIGRAISEDKAAAQVVSEDLCAAVKQARRDGGEAAGGLEHIRAVLGSLSPEIRAGLIHDEAGPNLDALTELAGVMPVMETCEALAQADLSPESLCHSTLMMFQRLATLSGGRSGELKRVASLASLVIDDSGASQETRALQTLRDLCHQASREEFTPKEYLDRLHKISAGQLGVAESPPQLEWETDDQERAHATEIILDLLDAGIGGEELVPGHLTSLWGSVDSIGASGRPDIMARASGVCESLMHHTDEAVREAATALRSASEDISTLALAMSRASTQEVFDAGAEHLGLESPTRLIRVLLRAYALDPQGAAVPRITDRLSQAGPELGAEIQALLEASPGAIETLLALINDLDADSAFGAIRPSLMNQPDAEARRRAFAAAYTLRHPWPRDLCHRALVEGDEKIRVLGAAYIVRRAQPGMVTLLADRLLQRLGGPEPTHHERASIIQALFESETAEASRALTEALLGAAWRPAGMAPGLGRLLASAVRSRPVGSRSSLAGALWSISPNRLIASLRRQKGSPDVD